MSVIMIETISATIHLHFGKIIIDCLYRQNFPVNTNGYFTYLSLFVFFLVYGYYKSLLDL